MSKVRRRPVKTQAPLTLDQRKSIYLTAITNKDFVYKMRDAGINEMYFNEMETHLYIVWITLLEFVSKHNKLPSYSELVLEVCGYLEKPTTDLDPDVHEDMDIFLRELRDQKEAPLTEDVFCSYLERLLNERIWSDLGALQQSHELPSDMAGMIGSLNEQVHKAAGIVAKPIEIAFPEGYEETLTSTIRVPFGIPFIDSYLYGGGAAGEVYTLLGPYGSCKTLLLSALSLSLADRSLQRWRLNQGRGSLGVSYLVTYELPKGELLLRALAFMANIDMNTLSQKLPLSTAGNLNERDKVLYADQIKAGLPIPDEKTRKKYYENNLNMNWRVLDFSGVNMENPMEGGGRCKEIADRIAADLKCYNDRGQKRHCVGVFVDYIGEMCRRAITVNNISDNGAMREYCRSAVNDARIFIANRFKCPVFMAHQLSPEGNKLPPGVIADRTMSAESKGTSENAAFTFVLSRPTTEDKILRMNCQKERRAGGLPPVTLQIKGEYSRVKDVSDIWDWDEDTRKFYKLTEHDARRRKVIKVETDVDDDYVPKYSHGKNSPLKPYDLLGD